MKRERERENQVRIFILVKKKYWVAGRKLSGWEHRLFFWMIPQMKVAPTGVVLVWLSAPSCPSCPGQVGADVVTPAMPSCHSALGTDSVRTTGSLCCKAFWKHSKPGFRTECQCWFLTRLSCWKGRKSKEGPLLPARPPAGMCTSMHLQIAHTGSQSLKLEKTTGFYYHP